MLSRAVIKSVKIYSKSPRRFIATAVSSKTFANHYKKLTVLGGLTGLACFDYFAKDGETSGAILRFARSLKIAVEISADYNFGLNGLDEDSEEYDKVRIEEFLLF